MYLNTAKKLFKGQVIRILLFAVLVCGMVMAIPEKEARSSLSPFTISTVDCCYTFAFMQIFGAGTSGGNAQTVVATINTSGVTINGPAGLEAL